MEPGAESSENELSTPPRSPEAPSSANSAPLASNGHGSTIPLGGAVPNAPIPAKNNNATPSTTTSAPAKKPRKKRESAANANANGEEKPKVVRKPRAPKDPNAPPVQRRKRVGKAADTSAVQAAAAADDDEDNVKAAQQQPATTKQPKITDLVGTIQPAPSPPVPTNSQEPLQHPSLSQVAAQNPSTPRPASSGQLYDPIRSSTVPIGQNHHAGSVPPVSPSASQRLVNRASASPSINSLIDPPPVANNLAQQTRFQPPVSVTSAPASPAAIPPKQNPFGPPSEHVQAAKPIPMHNSSMDVVMQEQVGSRAPPMKKTESAGTPPTAPTPPQKAMRQKEMPPSLPSGSGLLSATPLGLPGMSNGATPGLGANIWLTFPLKGQTNVTINFAREVEKKYGFAAMHPHIAAAKERRRQLAAATAALEKGSGAASADDMSVDLSEPESNVDMGGMDDDLTATGEKRKRKKKIEDYDKDDDFIDDTELAWEQSALMAKDGFFVYSGPLITAGEKPSVERADGTVKRGRGRGRGGTTRGDTTSGRGRGGGGRGSRGGQTVRKPRVTKADRAMMEQEKLNRERLAATLAAKPTLPYASAAT
ncbi:histone promoter control 2 [Saccharata proteae CBS 121410]|uniref:Histone promoter control 2 n=1 Tax=Saccharata proteae CBS 121410 TaxID=1314787 RepID=A0A9P4HQY6_9PEZI|nr:histone promoter control 2 [Saccharata proteae CBS 121410]